MVPTYFEKLFAAMVFPIISVFWRYSIMKIFLLLIRSFKIYDINHITR